MIGSVSLFLSYRSLKLLIRNALKGLKWRVECWLTSWIILWNKYIIWSLRFNRYVKILKPVKIILLHLTLSWKRSNQLSWNESEFLVFISYLRRLIRINLPVKLYKCNYIWEVILCVFVPIVWYRCLVYSNI